MQIEHGTFTPLVFSVNGGIAPECEKFHKHVAERISEKTGEKYNHVISWIRCKLSFLILRAALMCVRGSRPHNPKNATKTTTDYALACDDAQIKWTTMTWLPNFIQIFRAMNSPEFIFMINQRLALPYAYNRIFYNTICNFFNIRARRG